MKKIIIIGLSGLLLWSCNNDSKTEKAETQTETHAAHNDDQNSAVPELNNGEKWVVNDEMKPFVLNGSELVNTYIQEGRTDFKSLAAQLKDQNDQLIKSCTMKGKSHDELHKWLNPHLEMVKALEAQTDAAKANEIVLQLQNSYQQYHQYFN